MTKGFTMIVFQDSSTQNHIKKEENRLPRRLHSPHRKAIKVELIQNVSLFQEVEGVERVGDCSMFGHVPCSSVEWKMYSIRPQGNRLASKTIFLHFMRGFGL